MSRNQYLCDFSDNLAHTCALSTYIICTYCSHHLHFQILEPLSVVTTALHCPLQWETEWVMKLQQFLFLLQYILPVCCKIQWWEEYLSRCAQHLKWTLSPFQQLKRVLELLKVLELLNKKVKALSGNVACQHSQGKQYLKTKHIATDYTKGS